MVIIEVLKCQHCGAPLDVTPEDIIVVCSYCGYPNAYDKVFTEENVFFVESLPKSEILRRFRERIAKDPDYKGIRDKIEVVRIEGFYVPLWAGVVKGRGNMRYLIYEKRGNSTRAVVKFKKFEMESLVCVPARRSVYDPAVEELALRLERYGYLSFEKIKDILRYVMDVKPIVSLTPEKWESLELTFLNSDFGKEHAKMALLDRASDVAKQRRVPEDVELKFFKFEGDVKELALVFYPLWKVYYDVEGGTYFVAYDGHSGREVLAVEPVRLWRKVHYALVSLIGIAIAGFSLAVYGNSSYWEALANAGKGATALFLLPAVGAYLGFELARGYGKKVARDVRVEK
ncbi:hypothetical protein [Thermococcus sp.]